MVTVVRAGVSPVRLRDKNTGYEAAIGPDGRLAVSSDLVGEPLYFSDFNDNVAAGSPVTILSFAAGLSEKIFISGLSLDGSADGCFNLYINGDWIWRGRNSAAVPAPVFNFASSGFSADPGDLIELKVEHSANGLQAFAGSIFGSSLII